MISLRLIGIVADQPRLDRLAASLVAHGYACEIDVGDAPPATVVEPPSGDPNAPIAESVAAVDIICWTRASVGDAGAALKVRAISLKAGNDYLGLLLDDVEVPAEVISAQDVRLIGWKSPESGLSPLIKALDARINTENGRSGLGAVGLAALGTMMAATLASLRTVADALGGLRKKVNLGLAVSLGTFALGAFGFFANFVGTQEAICSTSALKPICRSLDLGNLPTVAEEKAWQTAKRGSECGAFEDIYGGGGVFAAEAKRRLDLARFDPELETIPLPMSVSVAQTSLPTESQARSEIAERAQVEATRMCSRNSQSFGGETAPGKFKADAPPSCYAADGGFLCSVSGQALCNFLIPGQIRKCPPMKALTK
jgi:hypothetical protein